MTRINRYMLYYRLINARFVIQLLWLVDSVVKILTGQNYVTGWICSIAVPACVLWIFIPAVLAFCRFMRDDFSEQLWQQAAGSVLKCLIILPVPLAFFISLGVSMGGFSIPGGSAITGNAQTNGVINGIIRSAVLIWLFTPVLFTFAFQWHRWRASR
jgi:hypothetical protein